MKPEISIYAGIKHVKAEPFLEAKLIMGRAHLMEAAKSATDVAAVGKTLDIESIPGAGPNREKTHRFDLPQGSLDFDSVKGSLFYRTEGVELHMRGVEDVITQGDAVEFRTGPTDNFIHSIVRIERDGFIDAVGSEEKIEVSVEGVGEAGNLMTETSYTELQRGKEGGISFFSLPIPQEAEDYEDENAA